MYQNKSISQQVFETKDISIAAFLYSTQQVQLVGKRRISEREVLFQFADKQKAEELVQAYWDLTALSIQPKQLFTAQRDLKDMIFRGLS